MSDKHYDDETIMAFADGALDDALTAEIEEAMDDDPALVERVALFAGTADLARRAMAPRLDAPVPPSLLTSIQSQINALAGSSAPSGIDRRALSPEAAGGQPAGRAEAGERGGGGPRPTPVAANENRRMAMRFAAIAASIAVVTAGIVGFGVGRSIGLAPPLNAGGEGTLLAAAGLEEALSDTASGAEARLAGGSAVLRPISTFRDAGDRVCREFEISDNATSQYAAVACRQASGWRIAFAVDTPAGSGGYVPASSLDALDSYLTSIDAGLPLSAEEETSVLGGLN